MMIHNHYWQHAELATLKSTLESMQLLLVSFWMKGKAVT